MMDPKEINWEGLTAPLSDDEIEWRVGQCGKGSKGVWAKLVPYIDARAVMRRLDEYVGRENWQDEYTPLGGAFICKLSIRVNGEWITKSDGADNSNIEATKGGISNALKRAAVKVGIGRELYEIGTVWATDIRDGFAPDGMIPITSDKNDIRAWCPPPKISSVGVVDHHAARVANTKESVRWAFKNKLPGFGDATEACATLKKIAGVVSSDDLPNATDEALNDLRDYINNLGREKRHAS